MRVFEFDSYKPYIVARVGAMPSKGKGQYAKIAAALRVHSTLVSQIFRGDRNLTLEQAVLLSEFLGFNELETDYLVNLVELERAGSVKLKRVLESRLKAIKVRARQVENQIPPAKKIKESDQAQFYSQWYYSAVRLLTSFPEGISRDHLAEALKLPASVVNQVVEFLLGAGLCAEKGGKLKIGPARTHINAGSPLVSRHHINWRLKAMESFARLGEEELAYTAPMTIAERDMPLVRDAVMEMISKANAVVEGTKPDTLACLNVDWVKIV